MTWNAAAAGLHRRLHPPGHVMAPSCHSPGMDCDIQRGLRDVVREVTAPYAQLAAGVPVDPRQYHEDPVYHAIVNLIHRGSPVLSACPRPMGRDCGLVTPHTHPTVRHPDITHADGKGHPCDCGACGWPDPFPHPPETP